MFYFIVSFFVKKSGLSAKRLLRHCCRRKRSGTQTAGTRVARANEPPQWPPHTHVSAHTPASGCCRPCCWPWRSHCPYKVVQTNPATPRTAPHPLQYQQPPHQQRLLGQASVAAKHISPLAPTCAPLVPYLLVPHLMVNRPSYLQSGRKHPSTGTGPSYLYRGRKYFIN